MEYPTRIAEPSLKIGREFQPGWGRIAVGETSLQVMGKAQAGCLSQFLFGVIVAAATAKEKSLDIPFSDITDVKASGKKLTVIFTNAKGKQQTIYLTPFQKRGFFGAKGPMAQEIADAIQKKSG